MSFIFPKIAFRNMRKYRTQSFTAIFGLAFGITCFVLGLSWILYETSFDGFYPDSGNIYRVYSTEKQSGKANTHVPGILQQAMHDRIPGTENSVGLIQGIDNYNAEGTEHIQLHTVFSDSSFFRVFPQTVLSGQSVKPLQSLQDIVITEKTAMRLFGDVEKAIGRPVKSSNLFFLPPYTVTSVVKDPPANSNLQFDCIVFSSIQHYDDMPEAEQWLEANQQIYLKVNPNTDVKKITGQLYDLTTVAGVNPNLEFHLLPIKQVRYGLESFAPFSLSFIRLYFTAGILLLLSGVFNFLNLHLDLFRQRIHELRQRKVSGATNSQLTLQMIFELACSILLALVVAFCLVVLVRPSFSWLVDVPIKLSQLTGLFLISGAWIVAAMLLVGSAVFWRLSRFATYDLSKKVVTGNYLTRRTAVIFQLVVSFAFIVAASVVMMQMRFVNRKYIGFERSGIMELSGLTYAMAWGKQSALRSELESIPEIENYTGTWFVPQYDARMMSSGVNWPGKPEYENPLFHIVESDSRFSETFRLAMSSGQ
ncbi:MAG: ABC transporter permease [Alistipes sp.]|nr:ABC transporter permease [Alistipes sp.]